MSRKFACVVGLILLVGIPQGSGAQEERIGSLTFETAGPEGELTGWGSRPPGSVSVDSVVTHGGRYAGRLELGPGSDAPSSILSMFLPVTFAGDTVELRGWLKTEGVSGFAGLWLREDGPSGNVQFDNMQSRNLAGTTDWTEWSIRLPLDDRARTLLLGALLVGEGTLWVDDMTLLVDGVLPEEAPPFVHIPTPVELDTEFNSGSDIETQELSPVQIRDLALLGKVWGFVKYHHPKVTAGEVNWDYELFRVLPEVLLSRDRTSTTEIMTGWIEGLGGPEPCDPCAESPTEAHLMPEVDWVQDDVLLGAELSHRLDRLYRARPELPEQYLVSPGQVGNPNFENEAGYPSMAAPDAGFRLLALFRLWNIIEYWFPYRDILGQDWDEVLAEFVPLLMAAEGSDEYRLAMMQLIARVNDTHANLWSELDLRPPRGPAQLPVTLRFIEGKAVVSGYSHETLGPGTGLRIGDVILALDGAPVDSLVVAWHPYYAASNQPTRLRDMARSLTRGEEGPVRVTGMREEGPYELMAERVAAEELDRLAGRTHDLPGETFQMLTPEVAYLKLSSVEGAQCDAYVRQAGEAEVLVIDIRNYPSDFVVFSLGGHLISEPTPFARFTRGDMSNPGAFLWSPPVSLQPILPRFTGKVVILVDEVSQSQAEYTTMAFRTSTNAIVVGSTTAGADGNISSIPLPGGINTLISGIGVFYPDNGPTQRIGILPDLEVRPTIQGIREGRDEVLEAGVSKALGRPFRLRGGGQK